MLICDCSQQEIPHFKHHRLNKISASEEFKITLPSLKVLDVDVSQENLEEVLENLIQSDNLTIRFTGLTTYFRYQMLEDNILRMISSRQVGQDFLLIRKNLQKSLYYLNGNFYLPSYL